MGHLLGMISFSSSSLDKPMEESMIIIDRLVSLEQKPLLSMISLLIKTGTNAVPVGKTIG